MRRIEAKHQALKPLQALAFKPPSLWRSSKLDRYIMYCELDRYMRAAHVR